MDFETKVEGIGICCRDLKTTPSRLKELVAMTTEFKEEIWDKIKDFTCLNEFYELAEQYDYGIGFFIIKVMNELEPYHFEADFDDYEYIYTKDYPEKCLGAVETNDITECEILGLENRIYFEESQGTYANLKLIEELKEEIKQLKLTLIKDKDIEALKKEDEIELQKIKSVFQKYLDIASIDQIEIQEISFWR